jgi:hypothetical protein
MGLFPVLAIWDVSDINMVEKAIFIFYFQILFDFFWPRGHPGSVTES